MSTDADARVDVVDSVMILTIDRPAQKNAMTLAAAEIIGFALTEFDERDDLSVAVLTGAGATFCAGMDLKRFAAGERPVVPGRGFGGITEKPPAKPIVAAVEGWALGGGFEMVLACDLVVAGRSALFGLPEVKRGLVARGGGLLRLPSRLPRAIAMELLITGEPLDAERAAHFGLVNHVVDDGLALDRARVLAEAIAANAPLAVRAVKAVADRVSSWPSAELFQRQQAFTDPVFDSEDAREGVAAFAERRAPRWAGR